MSLSQHYPDQDLPRVLPRVLVLGPPLSFPFLESKFSHEFHFLKPWESQLPLEQFISTHASSVQAVVSGAFQAVTASILRCLPSLKLIATTSMGVDHVDVAECRRRGVVVVNARNTFAEDVADIAVGLLIDVVRGVSAADRYVRQGLRCTKGDFPLGFKLRGKRIGIVGLGNIGSEVAKRLDAFGCVVSYTARKEKPFAAYPFYSNVCGLAANCDALINCCGLTDKTYHMINKEVMQSLGKNGVIINIGRGAVIDEKALVECLLKGEIGGAGLDVFENEPHVPQELMRLDNVVLSPHQGAISTESFTAICELVAANLDAFFSNKPLISPYVDA